MKAKTITIMILCLFLSQFASGSDKIPFPENIPLEHFSYFLYPTDVLGFMDTREGAEITPKGNIYTGYTELIFLQGPPLDHFPLRQHYWLEKEYLPIYYWVHELNGIEYRFTAFAAPLGLNPDNNLIIFIKITITNRSPQNKRPRFALGTRYLPEESEGSGRRAPARHRFRRPATPKRTGTYEQEGEAFSAEWMFEFKEKSLLRDGKILFTYSCSVEPDLLSYRAYEITLGTKFKQPPMASSPVGIAKFSKILHPGNSIEIEVKMPYTPVPPNSPQAIELAKINYSQMKDKVTDFWESILSRGMQIELAESKPVYVYKTGLIHNLIARDKIGDVYAQKVNEFRYDAFWLRDASYFVRSYDLGGYHKIARECLDFFFDWQRQDGNYVSQGGQYDGWGQVLWAFGQHYRLTKDREFAERALESIMKACDWLETEMKDDPLGIMPVTTPGDNEDIEDGHVTGHNFWALAGLKNALFIAEGLGKDKEALRIKSLHDSLNRNFLKALNNTLKKTGNFISPGMEGEGGQDWGNLMAVYPEEILPPAHPAVTETLRRSKEKYREKIMTYGDTKWLHHYLTMKNTETLVIRGEQEETLDEFYAILAHTSSTQAGFEYSIYPWSNRDFYHNLTPHGWFCAKFRNLLRSMLVRERNDNLHLLSVVSPAWASPGEKILVKNAPTYFGMVSFTAVFKKEGLELNIEPEFTQKPQVITVHLPYFTKFVSANAGKFKDGTLLISPETKKVVIQWERKSNAPYFSFKKAVKWLKEEYKKE